jgi:hypothetical protein
MTDLPEPIADRIVSQERTPRLTAFVAIAERAVDDPGIERGRLVAYAEELDERQESDLDFGAFESELSNQVTDADGWADEAAVYRLGDDRVSRYPPAWHDELGGSTDVAAYVAFLKDSDAPYVTGDEEVAGGPNISQQDLVDIVEVIGNAETEDVRTALREAREAGDIVQAADQHPDGRIYLPEDAGDIKGGTRNPR